MWVIDTGAERHLTYRFYLLSNVRIEEITCVFLPNNTKFKTTHVGDMKLKTIVDGVKKDLLIKEVSYRQDLGVNLLSHALIDEKGCFIVKQGDQSFIKRDNRSQKVTKLKNQGSQYVGTAFGEPQTQVVVEPCLVERADRADLGNPGNTALAIGDESVVVLKDSLMRLHYQLGHLNLDEIKRMG